MKNEKDMIKWLDNLKNDIGQPQHFQLWHYAEILDVIARYLESTTVICEHFYRGYCSRFEDGCFWQCQKEPKRPKGEWVDREQCQVDEDAYDVAICSNCKAEITLEYPNDNYCPKCGADMRGE